MLFCMLHAIAILRCETEWVPAFPVFYYNNSGCFDDFSASYQRTRSLQMTRSYHYEIKG